MRISTADGNGNIISDIFTGSVEEEKILMIGNFKRAASEKLLEDIPDFKQINAALGVYSESENAVIIARIQQTINCVSAYESAIAACSTFDHLKNI